MTNFLSSAAHAATKTLSANGHAIKRSHISEVLAAMLGYQTYAALVLEEGNSSLDRHLEDAEMLVLNRAMGELRAKSLGIAATPEVLKACIHALVGAAKAHVYEDLDDFYHAHARDELVDVIWNSDDVSAAMSETNAEFSSEPELPEETPDTEDLWKALTDWSIEARGPLRGDHHPDSDRMFAGDTLNCFGKLIFVKAGRAGLIATDAEGYAGVDDSWRDADRDDEAAYFESLRKP